MEEIKREILPNSREAIEMARPEYIVKTCPRCGTEKIATFGIGPEGKTDFSKLRMICWDCGKRQDYVEDKENKTFTPVEEVK